MPDGLNDDLLAQYRVAKESEKATFAPSKKSAYTQAELEDALRRAGFRDESVIGRMGAIGMAEAALDKQGRARMDSFNPGVGPGGRPTKERSAGPWQINTLAHPEYDKQKLLSDLDYNAKAAYDVFYKKKQGLKAWGAYTDGRYKKFYKGKPVSATEPEASIGDLLGQYRQAKVAEIGKTPTPTNPVNVAPIKKADLVVPEPVATLQAQAGSVLNGSSPKAAVLVNADQESEISPMVTGALKRVPLPDGRILFVNAYKASNLGVTDYARDFAKLLGKVEDVGDNTGQGQAVVTLGGDGTELNSSIVTSPQAAAKQASLDRAMFPNAAKQEILPAQQAALQRYQQWLVERQMKDERASVDAFNAEVRAENERLADEAARNQPQEQQMRAVQRPGKQSVSGQASATKLDLPQARVNWATGTGRSAKTFALDEAASQMSAQLGVDYDTVRSYLDKKGVPGLTDEVAEQRQKDRQETIIDLDENAVRQIKAMQAEVDKAKRRKETQTATAENQIKEYVDAGEVESVAQLLAAKDVGVKDIGGKPIDQLIQEERDAFDRFKTTLTNDPNEYNRILQSEQARLAAGETPESIVQQRYAAANQAKIDAVRRELVEKQYGSFAKREQEQKRIADTYGTLTDSSRPMARPAEFVLNIAREFAKLPGQAVNLAGIGVDAMSVAGVDPKDNPLIRFGESWKERVESSANKDLRDEMVVGDFSKGLAQLMQQTVLVPFTGGASILLPAGQAAESQYLEAAKGGAKRNARIGAALVGAIAAVPDAWLNFQFLKGLSPAAKVGFIENLSKELFEGLATKMSKNEARQVTIAAIGEFLGKAPVGYIGEKYQENLEDITNRGFAKATYKPELTWKDVFESSAREKQGYEAAGLVGIFGAGGGVVGTYVNNLSDAELKKSTPVLDEALKAGKITPEERKAIDAAVFAEAEKRKISLKPIRVADKKGNEYTVIEDKGDKYLVENEKGGQELRNKDRLTVINEEKKSVPSQPAQVDAAPLVQDQAAEVEAEVPAPVSGEQKKPAASVKAAEPVIRVHKERPKGLVFEAPLNPETLTGAKNRLKEVEGERDEERRRADEATIKANTNPLTGLGSKNAWDVAKDRIEADPNQEIVSFDLNRMKEANDTTSHTTVDDKVLRRLGSVTKDVLEANGVDIRNAFTPGGDELYVALPKGKAQKIRDEIEKAFGTVELTATKDWTNPRTGEKFSKGDVIPVTISGDFGLTVDEAEANLGDRKAESKAKNPVRRVDVKYATRPDGTLKTKKEYTPDEWQTYTTSVIDSKMVDLAPKAKEPWQMTAKEIGQQLTDFRSEQRRLEEKVADLRRQPRRKSTAAQLQQQKRISAAEAELNALNDREDSSWINPIQHEEAIREALREGKPVPAEVLADYPDLTPKQPAKQKLRPIQLGDFIEFFGEDAETASKILEITRTARMRPGADPIPMAGVPAHAWERYRQKLKQAGLEVDEPIVGKSWAEAQTLLDERPAPEPAKQRMAEKGEKVSLKVTEPTKPIEKARLKKAMNRLYDWDGRARSLQSLIDKGVFVGKSVQQGGDFNRQAYNRAADQAKYERELAAKQIYHLDAKDGSLLEVPKLVYDSIQFGNETDFVTKSEAPQSVDTDLSRNFRAGTNDATMIFASETQRDLYDFAANERYKMRGGQDKASRRAVKDIDAADLAKRAGVSESQLYETARAVYDDVKAQMKGVQHLEERQLTEKAAKQRMAEKAKPLNMAGESRKTVRTIETQTIGGPKKVRVTETQLPNGTPVLVREYKASNGRTGHTIYNTDGVFLEDTSGVVDLSVALKNAQQRLDRQKPKSPARERFEAKKAEAQTELSNDVEALPPSLRVTPEDLADDVTFKAVEAQARRERPRKDTGFTKSQTEFFVKQMQAIYADLPGRNQAGIDRLEKELKKLPRHVKPGSANWKKKAQIENEIEIAKEDFGAKGEQRLTIKVPADGTFTFYTKQGVDRIHKKLTGKTVADFLAAQAKPSAPKADESLQMAAPSGISLDSLYDKHGVIDYGRVKDVAGRVESGELEIRRLDPGGERGRVEGGRRNVEASLILAANEAAGQKAARGDGSRVDSHADSIKRQERELEEYAKREGIWFKPGHFPERLYVGKGGEARVYQKDATRVAKIIDYRHIDKGLTPQKFLDNRISLFNALFPESKYELMGMMRDGDGKFRFIVTQPFVQGSEIKSQQEVDDWFFSRGLKRSGYDSYSNKLYQAHDLHIGNVLKDANGNIFVIDAVPKPNYLVEPLSLAEPEASLQMAAPSEQTETPEFKRWFKDSKVVDENGKPKIMYHGTNADFDTFRNIPVYLTDNPALSGEVYGRGDRGNVMPVYVKAEKIFDTRKPEDADVFYNGFYGNYGNRLDLQESGLPEWTEAADFGDFFEEQGLDYDAAYLQEPQGDITLVVFNPRRQIKSAIGNSGAFDPNDDSILKMVASDESLGRFKDVQYAHSQHLLENSDTKLLDVDGEKRIEFNEEAAELARRVWASAIDKDVSPFYGATHTSAQLRKFAREARKAAAEYVKLGYTPAQVKSLKQMSDAFLELANQAHGVVYAYDFALPHETHHKLVLDALGGKPFPKETLKELESLDIWNANPTITTPDGVSKSFKKAYPRLSKQSKAIEMAAMLETGEIQHADKEKFLDIFARGILEVTDELDPVKFERILAYADTQTSDPGRDQTEQGAEPGTEPDERLDEPPPTESEGDGQRTQDQTASTGVGDGAAANPAPRTEKERKVASFSRILGEDYFYDPQSHEQTEVRAAQLLSDKGTQQAIYDALYGTPSAEGMRVVYWELERLTGALDNAIAEDNKAEIAAYSEAAADLSAKIVQRQVAGGQETEIAKMLVPLSPEAALLTAQKMVEYAKGEGSTLTADQTEKVIRLAQELKDARADIAKQDKKVKTLEKKIDKLKEERPTTRTARMLKQYRKRKPALVKELQDLFPEASVFNGETYSLQMVAPDFRSKKENDYDNEQRGNTTADSSNDAATRGGGSLFSQTRSHNDRGAAADFPEQSGRSSTLLGSESELDPSDSSPIFSVKPPKHLYRGVMNSGVGAGAYSLGKGLYSSPDKKWLRDSFKFDAIITLSPDEAFPRNPLVLRSPSLFPDWLLEESGHKNMREFGKEFPDPGEFVRSRGYDGVYAGDEVVRYFPEDFSFQMTAPADLTDQQRSKLVEYAAGEVLENKPYKTLISELNEFTGDEAISKEIHAEAISEMRSERGEMTQEAKDALKTRNEHYREADKILRPKGENQNVKPTIDKNFKKLNDQNVKELSRLARRVWAKTNDPLMTLAVERLNTDPKTINEVVKDIQRAKPEMTLPEATAFARKARQMMIETKQEMAEERDQLLGILPAQRRELQAAKVAKQKATMKLNKFLANLADDSNAIKRFNNDLRAKFVSNWGTQIFNVVQSVTVTNPAEAMLDLFTATLKATGLNIGETPDINAKDVLLPMSYIFANNKQMAEFALAEFPEQFFAVHSGLLGDIDIEPVNLSENKTGISKLAHKWFDFNQRVNNKLAQITGAKLQEMHFRNAMIAGTFDQIIRRKSDGKVTLKDAIDSGTLRDYITDQDAEFAASKALRVTFASQIDDKIGKKMKSAYDSLDSYVPLFLNPVTYARFTYTTTKVMVANPILFGALDSKALGGTGYNTRSLASGVLAWTGIAMAYGLMANFGGDDDEWYTLKFGDTTFDIRRSFPLSTYFYIAHLIKNFKDGKPAPTAKDLLEGFASLETDYFRYGAGVELATSIKDTLYGTKDMSDVGASSARLAGNFFAGYLRFFKPMRDALAQFDEEENKLRFYNNSGQDKFVQEIARSLPLVARAYGAEAQKDARGNEIGMPFPAGRIFGINIVHPSFLTPERSTATEWAARLFRYEGSGGEMSAEDRKAWQMRRTIKNAIRRGVPKEEVQGQMQAYRKQFGEKSFGRLKDELSMSELAAQIKYNFGMKDQGDLEKLRKVWSYATPQEQEALRKVLRKKKNRTAAFNKEFGLLAVEEDEEEADEMEP